MFAEVKHEYDEEEEDKNSYYIHGRKASTMSTKHNHKGSSKKSFNDQEGDFVVIGSGDMDYGSTGQPLTARDKKTRNLEQDNQTRFRSKPSKLIFVV